MNHSIGIRYSEKWDYLDPIDFMKMVSKYHNRIDAYCEKHNIVNIRFLLPADFYGMKDGEYLTINLNNDTNSNLFPKQ